MKTIKEKQDKYNIKPINAIITTNTIIPGKSGRKVNLTLSYNKMKAINSFKESLLVYNKILPQKSIKDNFDKVIISGNLNDNKISIINELDNDYCYTEDLNINKECILNHKYTILIHKITNNYLTKVKELIKNGIVLYIKSNDKNDLELITKYLKNNNYEIVTLDELITE